MLFNQGYSYTGTKNTDSVINNKDTKAGTKNTDIQGVPINMGIQ